MSMNIFTFDNFFPSNIAHGFFSRHGGVSTGLYSSLNCSYQSKDLAEHIDENRLRVAKHFKSNHLSTLIQTHSSLCHTIDTSSSCMTGVEEGDALVTKKSGHVIGCLTADCAPVLFYGEDNQKKPVIGVAHAGWGGALKGILESTVNSMVKIGAERESIKAAIGPCLAQENFEVSPDFIGQFVDEDKRTAMFFVSQDNSEKYLFNFPAYVEYRLKRAGIQFIQNIGIDTYSNENDYFSYRRATHRGEADYGRQISAIMIKA
jgi:YfiH family protein